MNLPVRPLEQPAPMHGRSWRLWAASLLIALFALFGLGRALQEPATEYRFEVSDGRVDAMPLSTARVRLTDVQAISVSGERVQLNSTLLTGSAGILNRYADQLSFFSSTPGCGAC